jgi:hypothetical protein
LVLIEEGSPGVLLSNLCALILIMPPAVQRTVTVAGLNFELARQYDGPVVLHVDDI